ncbi:D-2-hydroxyacid dehydrogenase [Bacillus sp. FJAT-49736]|uniref:D-2-hydroxyacid dehydrogenase n=1 Tax=Bacillus sp. FJAT-49736 TaxID=2833582 RepID=UPI001BC931FF|nr:D-2-hydroxyacid dehydrogenase [Bacillus sp. FJAT-49736]MBS4174963.1 D-2-hydroxyacid dehydrogenase [Bacillus sp. FJAT-49736]
MKKRKLVITQNIQSCYIDEMKKIIPNWDIIVGKDSSAWMDHLQDAEIIAGWKKEIKEYCIDQESKLRWLQSWSAGVNSFPLDKMANKGIIITSASGVHAFPISETIFALMLGLTRKVHTYVKNQINKVWHHANLSLEMHGKTVGIIGVGAIGKETAKIAKAFGMKVIGIRHSGRHEEFVDEMYASSQLNNILPQCDYVVVTLPSTNETYHMFGKEQFSLMKPSAFFINIGRGDTVVEKDLIAALLEGKIAGAGLDVFEKEPLREESPLWELENVIITPHTSGSTENYDRRVIEEILLPNLRHYVKELTPSINIVDYKKGY